MSHGEFENEMIPSDEGMLRRIAERVRVLGLTVPALAFLEMHRPLRGFAHAGALVAEPSLRLVMGEGRVSSFLRILERPECLDRLLELLETPSPSKDPQPSSPNVIRGDPHGRL